MQTIDKIPQVAATRSINSKLAVLGGPKSITREPGRLFDWPIVTREDEEAVLDVVRKRDMSGTAITKQFEKEFSEWLGVKYALGFNNGTLSLLAAMYALGIRKGDEVICPSITFWASCLSAYLLRGSVVFCDINPVSLCMDPIDIERRITPKTKAIVVVHYLGHPADMDPIMEIAKKHGIKVIEDVSHALGAVYKGRKVGTFGHVAGSSLMTGKSFAIGEAGILTTDDREIYERAIAFGHAERFDGTIETPDLKPFADYVPFAGLKSRMHQCSSAMGRVQLRHYDKRCAEIRKAMNYFWELLDGAPGLYPHRIDESSGSHMGGWYAAHGLYRKEELDGLSLTRFCQAVHAEGVPLEWCGPGCNKPLHTNVVFNQVDVFGDGLPTRIANSDRDLRQAESDLPVSLGIGNKVYFIPWFKHFEPDLIQEYADAFRKVAENSGELLSSDPGDTSNIGGWKFFNSAAPKK